MSRKKERSCRLCGCTDARACPPGCSWIEFRLCSACKEVPARAPQAEFEPKLLPGEAGAIALVLEVARVYGYGNLINHLQREWDETIEVQLPPQPKRMGKRCRCGHVPGAHAKKTGECWALLACGEDCNCRAFVPAASSPKSGN